MGEHGVQEGRPGRSSAESDSSSGGQDQFGPLKPRAVSNQIPLAVMGRADAQLPREVIAAQVGAPKNQRRRSADDQIFVFTDVQARPKIHVPFVERRVCRRQVVFDLFLTARQQQQERARHRRSAKESSEESDADGKREKQDLSEPAVSGWGVWFQASWNRTMADEWSPDFSRRARHRKLLLANQHLAGSESEANEPSLRADIHALERELTDSSLSKAARESKSATLTLLRRRAENIGRRGQSLDEIASDLARIEAQVALILENTTLEGKPPAVSADLDLASQLLDGSRGECQRRGSWWRGPPRAV
jgi:hypothetical protein